MRLELIRRPGAVAALAILSPLLAVALTVVAGFFLFAAVGVDPLRALYLYFIDPLTHGYSLEDLVVKATPIILTAIGLAFCYRANVWNIGAEGQLCAGRDRGLAHPGAGADRAGAWVLPAMLLLGILGGMAYGAIPALLKTRFGASEILVSLMLVYVAQLVRRLAGARAVPQSRRAQLPRQPPLRRRPGAAGHPRRPDPPQPRLRDRRGARGGVRAALDADRIPDRGRRAGAARRRLRRLQPQAAGAAHVPDFRRARRALPASPRSPAPIGQFRTVVSPGYGFTAIIVAFLGRLNPIAIFVAGLVLALTFLGGEGTQIALHLSDQTSRVFQGMLLFFVLACDSLIFYRLRIVRAAPVPLTEASHGRA